MSKQQVLCTTSSYRLPVETMIEGQSQTVQRVMGSTKVLRTHGQMDAQIYSQTVSITRSLPVYAEEQNIIQNYNNS